MTPELKEAWIEALRSGDYRQGDGALEYSKDEKQRYCCLGVLCKIVGLDTKVHGKNGFIDDEAAGRIGIPLAPPNEVERFGCASKVEENTGSSFQIQAASRNDSGWDFEAIADWIEQQPLEKTP